MEINITEVVGKKFTFFCHNNHNKLLNEYSEITNMCHSNNVEIEMTFPVYCFKKFLDLQEDFEKQFDKNEEFLNYFYNKMSFMDNSKLFKIK